jgi:Domain of unknown function (DUF4389)
MSSMDAYPLTFDITPPIGPRNRLTSALRIILAIPHLLLVGGPGAGWGGNSSSRALGSLAAVVSVIAWFAILFSGKFPRGLWDLSHMCMRWRARAIAYVALLRDESS